jgi:hypothetical protein
MKTCLAPSPLTKGHYPVTRKDTLDIKRFHLRRPNAKILYIQRVHALFSPDFSDIRIKVYTSIFKL